MLKKIKSLKSKKAFTLIELLVVIAIIAILAAVVFVALDPVKRFSDARNSRRFTDVNSILTAVHESIVDNDGVLPTGLTTDMSITELGTCTACANLASPLSTYLKTMPTDPKAGTAANTGYSVTVDTNNIITISSDDAENSVEVSVSR